MKPKRDVLVFQLEDMTADRDRYKAEAMAARDIIDWIMPTDLGTFLRGYILESDRYKNYMKLREAGE